MSKNGEYQVEFGEFLAHGGYEVALEHLTRSIASICRRDRGVTRFYIGKASGKDPTSAISGRYDENKVFHEFTEDWALYQSEGVGVGHPAGGRPDPAVHGPVPPGLRNPAEPRLQGRPEMREHLDKEGPACRAAPAFHLSRPEARLTCPRVQYFDGT